MYIMVLYILLYYLILKKTKNSGIRMRESATTILSTYNLF